ncbi:glycosyltransferase family 2 protein [Microbacterium binotii]|uniref:glycosyltransferase family 2 protein n=1 Tax=Microbacterium binotii TaxID=462710 RepID=UPI001F1AFCCC|nr:glycosyltransferase [Microbacterium binotii]UIN29874.1 glycosyltransferase [Microbacterium binotii]
MTARERALVTVVVPVFNAQSYLDATVQSILAQEYTELEVILVDDGSTDGSAGICDRWAREDSRVRVIHRANGGIAAAQNSGLDAATGALITFCDNDDLMLPQAIGRLVDILEDADADMSCCRWSNVGASAAQSELDARRMDPPGRVEIFGEPGRKYQEVFSLAHRRLRRRELQYFSEANWGKLYRAELWDGVRFPEGRYAQDVAVSMDLYLRMSRVASCSDVLYLWLQHPSSVSHSARRTSYFHDIVRAHGHAFDLAWGAGIVPVRAYGGMMTLDLERRSVSSAADLRMYREDAAYVRERISRLSWTQRLRCRVLHAVRRLEVQVYRRTIHRRR